MDIGMVGLGRMGGNMSERLRRGGHRVVSYDRDPDTRQAARASGCEVVDSLEQFVDALAAPRVVWVMVPSGNPTEATVAALGDVLEPGDLVVDGGNSNYNDSMRRGESLRGRGIEMVDAGVSGGIWGLAEGYCLMVGGSKEAIALVEPVFRTLAPTPEKGYAHVGPLGAGHFVKMVHNGIEYGLMQAYAEGFELMRAKQSFDLDVAQIAEIWRHGSVVRSWLLDLTAAALDEDASLSGIAPWVEDSGEGRWTVEESVELAVPLPVISMALQARFRSRDEGRFGFRLLAAMRNQFGGHAVRRQS
ncbi:MAG: decarboxylating 6-phosphogluconate dehydrogenase [Chloroflexota bacterium]|nr:decarboxylating 6-phosphogluconate dehydrogenase [Chloroflexota bacterium]MDE2885771.1 decarboxylating 6-phosphogluconate dehydrogenase [Chloroflexota bacterium]